MVRNNFFAISLICLLLTKILTASDGPPEIERLPFQPGIALDLTYCILKDSRGYVWFGTMHGLVKYDGYRFTLFNHHPHDSSSMSFNDVISLYEDNKKNIWIGTWGGGINRLNTDTEKFTSFPGSEITWAFDTDASGNIWAGTTANGILKFDKRENTFRNIISAEELKSRVVNSIHFDAKGTLWIGTNTGLKKYSDKLHKLEDIKIPFQGNAVSINVIKEYPAGTLILGSSIGLLKYYEAANKLVSLEKEGDKNQYKGIRSISLDSAGNIWAGTVYGLKKFDKYQKISTYFSSPLNKNTLSGSTITSVEFDNSGLLWIASYESGINKLFLLKNKFQHFGPGDGSLNSSRVTSFFQDNNGNIWIGTIQGGLNLFNQASNDFNYYLPPDLRSFSVNCIFPENEYELLLGTNAGLYQFNIKSRKFRKKFSGFNYSISTLYEDSIYIWTGTSGNGIYRIGKKTGEIESISFWNKKLPFPGNDIVVCMLHDKKGNLWFGTYAGLLEWDAQKQTFNSFTHDEKQETSLSNNYVFSLFQDDMGYVWAGTSSGLNKFDISAKIFTSYFEQNGLPNNIICGITADKKGKLWITTYNGISRFNPRDNTFENYSSAAGLQNYIFNYNAFAVLKSGEILFGSKDGFISFNPDSLNFSSSTSSTAIITSAYAADKDGKIIKLNNNIPLSFNQNSVTFEFSALDYKNPSLIRYKYMLEGLDKSWRYTIAEPAAIYNDIPPGEYKFKVSTTGVHSADKTGEADFDIIIMPPFWRTAWFISAMLALVIILLYISYSAKIKSKIKRALEIEKIKEEQEEKIRKKTALDFHDELGHRLTRINLLAEILKSKIKPSQVEVLPYLDKISDNSRQLYEGTRDFIWSIDPQKDSLLEFVTRLKDFGDELFTGTEINFEMKGYSNNFSAIQLKSDWRRELTLIFKEALNNSLKHSKCSRVVLEVNITANNIYDNNIEVSLTDNGIGFIDGINNSGNGLASMKLRTDKLNGIFQINSKPNDGTKIIFKGKIPGNSLNLN